MTVDEVMSIAIKLYPDHLLDVVVRSSPGIRDKVLPFFYAQLTVNGSLVYSTGDCDSEAATALKKLYLKIEKVLNNNHA